MAKSHHDDKISVRRNFSPEHEADALIKRLLRFASHEQHGSDLVRTVQYKAAQRAAVEADVLSKDEEVWRAFLKHPFWETVKGARPKVTDHRQALRYTVRVANGGDVGRTSERKRAIERLLDNGVAPRDIAAELESRGGFKGVNRADAKSTTGKLMKTINSGKGSGRSPRPNRLADATVEEDAAKSEKSTRYNVDLSKSLLVNMAEHLPYLEEILDTPDQRFLLTIMNRGRSKKGFAIVKVVAAAAYS